VSAIFARKEDTLAEYFKSQRVSTTPGGLAQEAVRDLLAYRVIRPFARTYPPPSVPLTPGRRERHTVGTLAESGGTEPDSSSPVRRMTAVGSMSVLSKSHQGLGRPRIRNMLRSGIRSSRHNPHCCEPRAQRRSAYAVRPPGAIRAGVCLFALCTALRESKIRKG